MITPTTSESFTLKAKLNLGYIWLISLVAASGGLLFGYDRVVIAPALLFLVGMFLVPESPRWLAKNGQRDPARRVLSLRFVMAVCPESNGRQEENPSDFGNASMGFSRPLHMVCADS